MQNMREVIRLCLDDEDCDMNSLPEFVGVPEAFGVTIHGPQADA